MTIFGCQTFHTSDQLFFDGKESKQGGFRNSSVLFKTERENFDADEHGNVDEGEWVSKMILRNIMRIVMRLLKTGMSMSRWRW